MESQNTNLVLGLKRISDSATKYRFIKLEGKEQVKFGRSVDVQVCLSSNMISRCHAILQKTKDHWTAMDNKSVNGVFVNDVRLAPSKPKKLEIGDILRLAVPPSKDKPAEFVWRYGKFKVCAGPNRSAGGVKRRPSPVNDGAVPSTSASPSSKPPLKRLCPASPAFSPGREYREKLAEAEREAASKIRAHEEQLEQMERRLREKATEQEQLAEQLEQQQKEMREQMAKQQAELEAQKTALEERMRTEYEEQLAAQEAVLAERLATERDSLLAERQKVEEQLQQEMERQLEEKDQQLQTRLEQQKASLDKVLETKACEQRLLEAELESTKTANQQQQQDLLRAREEVLTNLADLMETELQCSICNELFVQATSLNCSHSFCAMCISQWMAVKRECPVCRARITSHLRSLVLDSYIDRMVEQLSDDLKASRKALVEERKQAEADMKKKAQEAAAAAAAAALEAAARGRGRGRGRRGRVRGGRAGAVAAPVPAPVAAPIPHVAAVVVIDDNDDDESVDISSDDDSVTLHDEDGFSDSSVEGDPDEYYGGYGECFHCGRRGHWVGGCPYR